LLGIPSDRICAYHGVSNVSAVGGDALRRGAAKEGGGWEIPFPSHRADRARRADSAPWQDAQAKPYFPYGERSATQPGG